MGLQLIFVVETNKKCKSDWIYIKDTMDKFYLYDMAHVKLSTVYLDGKTKYKDNGKKKEVENLLRQYINLTSQNKSVVIYCFDCDDHDTKADDKTFLEDIQEFCKKKNEEEKQKVKKNEENNQDVWKVKYEFVWFCKDIERVYLGKEVNDKQKKEKAVNFKANNLINKVNERKLSAESYRNNSSNILSVLDKYIPPLARKFN